MCVCVDLARLVVSWSGITAPLPASLSSNSPAYNNNTLTLISLCQPLTHTGHTHITPLQTVITGAHLFIPGSEPQGVVLYERDEHLVVEHDDVSVGALLYVRPVQQLVEGSSRRGPRLTLSSLVSSSTTGLLWSANRGTAGVRLGAPPRTVVQQHIPIDLKEHNTQQVLKWPDKLIEVQLQKCCIYVSIK